MSFSTRHGGELLLEYQRCGRHGLCHQRGSNLAEVSNLRLVCQSSLFWRTVLKESMQARPFSRGPYPPGKQHSRSPSLCPDCLYRHPCPLASATHCLVCTIILSPVLIWLFWLDFGALLSLTGIQLGQYLFSVLLIPCLHWQPEETLPLCGIYLHLELLICFKKHFLNTNHVQAFYWGTGHRDTLRDCRVEWEGQKNKPVIRYNI